MSKTYLKHHGILGQKWGIRRYQNKDGSLTPAGVKRAKQDFKDRHSKMTMSDGEHYVANYKTKKRVEEIKDEDGKKISRYQSLQVREKNNQMATYTVDEKYNTVVGKQIESKGKTKIVDLDDASIARGQKIIDELTAKQNKQWDKEFDKEEKEWDRLIEKDIKARDALNNYDADQERRAGVKSNVKVYRDTDEGTEVQKLSLKANDLYASGKAEKNA